MKKATKFWLFNKPMKRPYPYNNCKNFEENLLFKPKLKVDPNEEIDSLIANFNYNNNKYINLAQDNNITLDKENS